MTFNAAILHDIENLTKGNYVSEHMKENLRLTPIISEIQKSRLIEKIAVHRGFANWSNWGLNFLQPEIVTLGIEPVQLFGFTKNNKKNAADIALAVDAMDLVSTRPHISTFAIVSGDGGFSYLANKLHTYGKFVIGASYSSSRSDTFKSVCDEFIDIPDPDLVVSEKTDVQVTAAKACACIAIIEKASSADRHTVFSKIDEILDFFALQHAREMASEGIKIGTIQQSLTHLVPGFSPVKLGFSKLSTLLNYICRNKSICLYANHPSMVIGFRQSPVSGYTINGSADRSSAIAA